MADQCGVPPMPDGFTDRAAWDAIHWQFSDRASLLDEAAISWQLANQDRVRLAAEMANAQNGD